MLYTAHFSSVVSVIKIQNDRVFFPTLNARVLKEIFQQEQSSVISRILDVGTTSRFAVIFRVLIIDLSLIAAARFTPYHESIFASQVSGKLGR